MQVVPVIDLMGGQVVRGVAGERSSYRRITSRIAEDASPASVAQAFRRLGLTTVYAADLDAIGGAACQWDAYRAIARCGSEMMIDAGFGSADAVCRFLAEATGEIPGGERWPAGIIFGLESLQDEAALIECGKGWGSRGIFSLDLKGGRPLTSIRHWQTADPLDLAQRAAAAGFQRLIVLDLAQVGREAGLSILPLLGRIRAKLPEVMLLAGGGVRNGEDLRELERAGADAALVASALHAGVDLSDQAP